MATTRNTSSILSKYGSIIISVLLFLLLTASVLGFNYFFSQRIADKTQEINISARQGILTQQLAKDVVDIDLLTERLEENDGKLSEDALEAIGHVRASSKLFDQTLIAFDKGGETIGINGESITLEAVTNPTGVKSVQNGIEIWLPFKRLIDSFLISIDNGEVNKGTISYAADYSRIFNTRLYGEMNDLNSSLAAESTKDSTLVQRVLIGGLIAALLLFAYIVFGALRQLMQTDSELEEARQETNSIMKTVNEGLFLVDEDLTIGNQYSSQLESIILQEDIAGKQLGEVLEPMVSRDDVETIREFIEQLFNPKVKEKLIQDLNPLDRVEIQVLNDITQEYENRYLTFNFSRVYEGKRIASVLTSVSDITRSVKLEQRLELEREQNDQQLAMLSNVLHADDEIMAGFIRHSNEVTNNINEVLKRPETSERGLQQKARDIFREIHGLKGEASALKLDNFISSTTSFEDKLTDLQNKRRLTGNDFLSLTVDLESIIEDTNKAQQLMTKLSGSSGFDAAGLLGDSPETSSPSNSAAKLEQHFEQYAQDVANRNQKQVNFRSTGLDSLDTDPAILDKIKDTITQLIRNAIVHGIETPADRAEKGKNQSGIVQVGISEPSPNTIQLTVDDDGNGLNIDIIRQKAIENGLITPDQAASMTQAQYHQLIFHSGLSTADSVGEDAGRGVGMDVIKERVKQLNGKIGILSEPGKYTRFVIQFPL